MQRLEYLATTTEGAHLATTAEGATTGADEMTHLMLTSALLFALLAVVAIAIGASLGIARDMMMDDSNETSAANQSATSRSGHGLGGDFGLGLRHATHFAQDSGRAYRRGRSFNARI
jgi:hypothetical protein